MRATQVESILDKICKFDGWKRHKQISSELRQTLAEQHDAAQAISKTAFDSAVQFLVESGMRRKAAIEECLTLILDNRWQADESEGNPWFSRKLEQFGLD